MAQMRDIRSLTGIRGVAALFVLMYHLQYSLDVVENHDLMRFGNGYLAVDLFFILSGFVMSLNYRSRFASSIALRDYAAFILRRLKRLFPLYWAICAVAIFKTLLNFSGVQVIDLSLANIFKNAAMIHSWGFQAERFVVPSWSVSAEFLAYFLFPFVVLISRPFRHWPVVTVAVAFAMLIAVRQSGLGESGPMDVYQTGTFYPLLRCFAGFALGMAAHALSVSSSAERYLKGDAVLVALLAGIGLGMATHADILLIGVLFPLLIVSLALNDRLAERLFGNGPAYYLGLISYSIYLVHPLVISSCIRLGHIVERQSGIPTALFAAISALGVTIAVATLTYHAIERGAWFEKGGRFLAGLRRPAPARA